MILLERYSSEYLLSIDIETVRIEENFEDLSEEYQSAWEYLHKREGKIPTFEELSELWLNTSAFYAEFSKICAISIAYINKNKSGYICREYYGPDEKFILQNVSAFLNAVSNNSNNFRLMGHAAKSFDYPFMCRRYVINGMSIPTIIDTAHLKPWENQNIDTKKDIWSFGGTGKPASLHVICTAMGVPTSKVDLAGDEVGNAYFRGEYSRIGRYCSYDTIALFNVIRKLKSEPIFNFDEVDYKVNVPSNQGDKIGLLKMMHDKDSLTDEIKEEIRAKVKENKLTKSEIEVVRHIILGAYIKEDFIGGSYDKKEVKEAKEVEVAEFINSL